MALAGVARMSKSELASIENRRHVLDHTAARRLQDDGQGRSSFASDTLPWALRTIRNERVLRPGARIPWSRVRVGDHPREAASAESRLSLSKAPGLDATCDRSTHPVRHEKHSRKAGGVRCHPLAGGRTHPGISPFCATAYHLPIDSGSASSARYSSPPSGSAQRAGGEK
jgi:hypothetical protein